MRITCGGESVRLQPRLLGAGLLLGAVLEVLRASGIDWTREDGSLALAFNQWTAIALIVLSVIRCASWAIRTRCGDSPHAAEEDCPPSEANRSMSPNVTALAACAVLLLTGCYVTGAPLLAAALSLPSMIVTGVAFAVGIAVFAALWFDVYTALDTRTALVHASLCIGVASLVRFVMASHDALTTLLVFATCCLASYGCIISRPATERIRAMGELGNEPLPDGRTSARSIAPILWLPLAAVSIVSFIQGLVWNPIASQTTTTGPLNIQMFDLPLGGMAACAFALLFLRHATSESQCQRIVTVGFPVTMGALLLYPVVVPVGSIVADLTGWLPQCGFALVILFTWHSLTAAQRASHRPDLPVLPFGLVFISVFYVIGLLLIHIIGTGGRDLCLVFLTIYLVLFCVSLTQETKTEQQGRISDELRPKTFIHRRCDELAAEHGISPRETEVLYYLGRGYNHTYIARKLFVSENTVRTHVRHIYGKLDISSREDLLDLIDEDTADSTEAPHRA